MTARQEPTTAADLLFILEWCVQTLADRTGHTITRGQALDMLGAPERDALAVIEPAPDLLSADDRARLDAVVRDVRREADLGGEFGAARVAAR